MDSLSLTRYPTPALTAVALLACFKAWPLPAAPLAHVFPLPEAVISNFVMLAPWNPWGIHWFVQAVLTADGLDINLHCTYAKEIRRGVPLSVLASALRHRRFLPYSMGARLTGLQATTQSTQMLPAPLCIQTEPLLLARLLVLPDSRNVLPRLQRKAIAATPISSLVAAAAPTIRMEMEHRHWRLRSEHCCLAWY